MSEIVWDELRVEILVYLELYLLGVFVSLMISLFYAFLKIFCFTLLVFDINLENLSFAS